MLHGTEGATQVHVDLVEHLVALVTVRLIDPLAILLDDAVAAAQDRVRIEAQTWSAQLLGPDDRRAVDTAARLISALYPGDEAFDPPPDWWSTPFGQVVLCRMGHPARESVTYAVAGAMLGITRQGVHDLVGRGKLQRHPDGGVTTASVRDRAVRRISSTATSHDEHTDTDRNDR
ncbi:hypothetical protein [Phytoactinopolyspora halotolerans]|uniref:Uncharacterized protein n=1 Tax=Phytoactinopolyspora halotolerans TaxID=1981512 RepID=A0A6L9S6N6_9ACTN|nr:hypothetical protein [Phytoactinopolyspora halotolerans]NEE00421.1 hypothetical protein [Phytoactinopolyspora halotolerans]